MENEKRWRRVGLRQTMSDEVDWEVVKRTSGERFSTRLHESEVEDIRHRCRLCTT